MYYRIPILDLWRCDYFIISPCIPMEIPEKAIGRLFGQWAIPNRESTHCMIKTDKAFPIFKKFNITDEEAVAYAI